MSFRIYQVVLVFAFMHWTQAAAVIKDTANKTVETFGSEAALRLKEMGVDVKFLQDSCMCEDNSCGCCFQGTWPGGNNTETLCFNGTFVGAEFEVRLTASLNNENLGTYALSGRNPPPICFPVILPVPLITMCIKARDIYQDPSMENRIHLCANIVMKFAGLDFLNVPFSCMIVGYDGLQFVESKIIAVRPDWLNKYGTLNTK